MNMKKWFPRISSFHMLFDSDSAGQNSTVRAIMILSQNGVGQYVHRLTGAKDASELLEKGGENALREEFESYVSGFDYLVQNSLNHYDVKNARDKSLIVGSLGEYLLSCHSEVERDSYILSLSSLLGLDEASVKEDLKKLSLGSVRRGDDNTITQEKNGERKNIQTGVSYDLFVMLYLCNHRSLFSYYRSRISFGDLEDSDAQKLYMALENAMRDDVQTEANFLTYISDDELRNHVSTSFMLKEYTSDRSEAVDEVIKRIALRGLERKRTILNRQISMLGNDDEDASVELMTRKIEYDNKISKLKREISGFENGSAKQ